MLSRQSAAMQLLIFAFLLVGCDRGSGCDGNIGSPSTISQKPTYDLVEPDTFSFADTLQDAADSDASTPPPDLPLDLVDAELPPDPPICQPGDVECKYDNKAERLCIEGPNGVWYWDKVEACDEGLACILGTGCTCEFGSCDQDSIEECSGIELNACQGWTCGDGCCDFQDVLAPDCCITGSDCQDCFYPSGNGERFPCLDGFPGGMVPDLCTQDICIGNDCSHSDKICDDGDDMTLDTCDPPTGECVNAPDGYWEPMCWGITEEDAAGKCFDNNLCTLEICDFGGEFESWEGPEAPWFNSLCTEQHPDWPDCDPKPSNVYYCKNEPKACDNYDKCTIDSCDPETGCMHEFDFDKPECWCGDDDDCADEDACTVEYCNLDAQVCVYPQLDCSDDNICTIDTCNPDSGCHQEQDYPPDECSLLCLTDDPDECDDGDACTTDFCDVLPEDEFGFCMNFLIACDDGDPETEEACVDGECVVL
jgi:hypothetical protein